MLQGAVFGIIVAILAHIVVMPILGHTPPLWEIPFDEHVSEIHIIWIYGIELV